MCIWKHSLIQSCGRALLASLVLCLGAQATLAQVLVPGTGTKISEVGDDFEDAGWTYHYNGEKSSYNVDKNTRDPQGYSENGRWFESAKRGQPDVVKRVSTPAGGLPGSTGALLLQSRYTAIPNMPTGKSNQDDFIASCGQLIGGNLSFASSPSVVVRVYMPPFDQWEDVTGTSFGFRCGVFGPMPKYMSESYQEKLKEEKKRASRRLFGRVSQTDMRGKIVDQYYPGMFIQFNSETDADVDKDSAFFIIRAGDDGQDYVSRQVTPGWWTLGMSFTPDGRVHYFAKPGVEKLTMADHIASHYSYGIKGQTFNTFFLNVANSNTGRWSTPWVVDDAEIYALRR